MALRLKTRSEDDTFALGRALGAFLRPGDALLLSGDLGTGKSVLARGAARSLGVEGPMPSPSFTILFPYEGKCPVYHFDLYRLSGPDEFEAAGLYEWFGGAGRVSGGVAGDGRSRRAPLRAPDAAPRRGRWRARCGTGNGRRAAQ